MVQVHPKVYISYSQRTVDALQVRRALGFKFLLPLLLLISLAVRLALVPVRMNRPDRRDYIGSAQKIVRFGLVEVKLFFDGEVVSFLVQ